MEIEPEKRTGTKQSQSIEDTSGLLLNRLKKFKGKKPLFLATSPESVDLAKNLARQLGGDFEKMMVKKLVDPKNPSRSIGAVNELGGIFLSQEAAQLGYTVDSIQERILGLVEEMQRIRRQHPVHNEMQGRPVIFVDIGSRTGYRLMAALQSVKTYPPKIIVVATPSMSHRSFALINNLCDEVIALKVT
jgi:putative phosphoribosyl transferase